MKGCFNITPIVTHSVKIFGRWNLDPGLINQWPYSTNSVPWYQYRCINVLVSVQCISAMYLASGLPGLPGYQAPPTRPNQALPGPTRTYQNPALPGLGLPKDHTPDHILFWQPPKTPPKQHTFSGTHLKKQKHTFWLWGFNFRLGILKFLAILNSIVNYKPQLQATRAKHVLVKWCQVGSAKQVFICCTKYLAFIQWLQGLQILMTSAIQNAKLHSLSPRGLRESESIRVYTSETVQKRSKTTLPFFQRHLMRYTNYTSTNTETEHSCTALFKFCGREP